MIVNREELKNALRNVLLEEENQHVYLKYERKEKALLVKSKSTYLLSQVRCKVIEGKSTELSVEHETNGSILLYLLSYAKGDNCKLDFSDALYVTCDTVKVALPINRARKVEKTEKPLGRPTLLPLQDFLPLLEFSLLAPQKEAVILERAVKISLREKKIIFLATNGIFAKRRVAKAAGTETADSLILRQPFLRLLSLQKEKLDQYFVSIYKNFVLVSTKDQTVTHTFFRIDRTFYELDDYFSSKSECKADFSELFSLADLFPSIRLAVNTSDGYVRFYGKDFEEKVYYEGTYKGERAVCLPGKALSTLNGKKEMVFSIRKSGLLLKNQTEELFIFRQ